MSRPTASVEFAFSQTSKPNVDLFSFVSTDGTHQIHGLADFQKVAKIHELRIFEVIDVHRLHDGVVLVHEMVHDVVHKATSRESAPTPGSTLAPV